MNVFVVGDATKHTNYFNAISAAGGVPYSLEDLCFNQAIDFADAIVIQGGVDINPATYKEQNTHCIDIDDELDTIEELVLKEAANRKILTLGICRGLQIMNVFLGGSLVQHIDCAPLHARDKGSEADKIHSSTVERGSFVYGIYQQSEITINSAHHQAIKTLGRGLRAVQYSHEGIIEAVQHDTLPFYALQWHPERLCLSYARADAVDGLKVFDWLINRL